mmetsp:Transcript_120333/g.312308  ORF Transcript_120333/g.312308 Transcript_120333/m.312308 type:complete len:255 (+) Transcript_120333:2463-3227(+)
MEELLTGDAMNGRPGLPRVEQHGNPRRVGLPHQSLLRLSRCVGHREIQPVVADLLLQQPLIFPQGTLQELCFAPPVSAIFWCVNQILTIPSRSLAHPIGIRRILALRYGHLGEIGLHVFPLERCVAVETSDMVCVFGDVHAGAGRELVNPNVHCATAAADKARKLVLFALWPQLQVRVDLSLGESFEIVAGGPTPRSRYDLHIVFQDVSQQDRCNVRYHSVGLPIAHEHPQLHTPMRPGIFHARLFTARASCEQ